LVGRQRTKYAWMEKLLVIINNPCIEFWYLLHFGRTSKYYANYESLRPDLRRIPEMSQYEKHDDYYNQNPDIYVKIYETLANSDYEEQGQDYIDQAMALDMKFTDFQKGKLLFCKGDYEAARTSLEKARLTEEPGVILYLGRTYEALGDSNYAASLYKTYIEKKPDDVDVLNQLGLCLIESKDYDGALAAFQSALNVEGCSITQTLKFNEIVAYEYKADFKQAAVLMKTYLESYPDDETAKREYIFLKSR